MEALDHQRKSLTLILLKKTQICFSLHYNADNSYLFVNEKKESQWKRKFKANSKNVNFCTEFCLGSISNEFSASESRELSLNGNVYSLLVDCNCIVKSDILNSHKYLMNKNNVV